MVEIQISGVHYHVSDRLRSYILTKLGGLRRFCPDLNNMHVTIHEGDKFGFRVDVELHLPQGKDVIAHDSEDTVYSAVDVVADKCAAQLRKVHSKRSKHRSRSDRHNILAMGA